jgi:predicted PurR-regulated permease PerM
VHDEIERAASCCGPARHEVGIGLGSFRPVNSETSPVPRVHPRVAWTAAYAWRLLVIVAALVALLWLFSQLIVIVMSIAVAVMLTRALVGPADWLEHRGVPRALSAGIVVLLAIVSVVALLGWVSMSVASEFDEFGASVSQGVDEVETWLVEDSPFDLDRTQVREFREEAAARLSDVVSSEDSLRSSAVLIVEIATGLVLALVVAFFVVKDRDAITRFGLRAVPSDRRPVARALGKRAWDTLGGDLRGVALLGVVEAIAIGATVWIVGGRLVGVVVVITLLGAFVPIVGAVVAGVVAVLATLATAGTAQAVIVAVVALAVQQLDNDLLVPVIYGKSLQLHPLVILLGIASGTALFGFVGALLAVPVISVAINVVDEARHPSDGRSSPVAESSRVST